MKTIKKSVLAFSIISVMMFFFAGCSETVSEEELARQKAEALAAKEVKQNDYRGGIKRTLALKENVIGVLETMKSNNGVLREDNPNSFWTADGYQDFVSTFLDYEILNDTQWFNEESASWEETAQQISSQENSFTLYSDGAYRLQPDVNIIRNEKDDYAVTNVAWIMNVPLADDIYTYNGKANFRVLYDCDKDWCKAYSTMQVLKELPVTTVELFEYQRINDDTYVIQTSRERLMVVLKPAESDTDIRNREIKEFYYSKLVAEGQRTTFDPYVPLPEYDNATKTVLRENEKFNLLMAENPAFNDKGECCNRYGEADSMFFVSPYEMSNQWVFEDKSLQQAICYKDGVLLVTTYNKLSSSYERFLYSMSNADENIKKELENLVEIKNLVGIVEVKIIAKPDTEKKPNEIVVTEPIAPVSEVTSENATDGTIPAPETNEGNEQNTSETTPPSEETTGNETSLEG